MKVLVDGKEALLKSGFSFEFVAENRLFLGRDGYTLSIVFPMKDCPRNVAIFGNINRVDVDKRKLAFSCALIDSHVSLFGSLSVVKISDTEIEAQFAQGRCEQVASDPFEETYVNELDLGQYPFTSPSEISPADAWRGCDGGMDAVALPWINEGYSLAPNNWAFFNGSEYAWHPDLPGLSWQPYLLFIAKKICSAIDYAFDFSAWESSGLKYLIICNSLPYSWGKPSFAEALPRWTVSEFFEKLELLLKGEFEFDHRAKTVKFSFSKDVLARIGEVWLQSVVDKYSSELSADDSGCDYIGAKRLAYKDCGHQMSNFYACDWLVDGSSPKVYDSLQTIIDTNKRLDYDGFRRPVVLWGEKTILDKGYNTKIYGLMYAQKEKTFFTMRSIGTELFYQVPVSQGKKHYTQVYVLQPVNVFGSGAAESDDTDTVEIEFCPVCISDTYIDSEDDMGYMMYLSPSSADEESSMEEDDFRDNSATRQIPFVKSILAGNNDSGGAGFYDVVYVGFWTGTFQGGGELPYPFVDPVTVRQNWTAFSPGIPDLRLFGTPGSWEAQTVKIDKRKKFKFSWIGNVIPNPRALFNIKGRRYLCEKITATFTEHGMSQLLKGEFYPLLDD